MSEGYSKGLEGVIADESSICLVDGQAGELYYRGHSIAKLVATKSFDQIAFMMLHGDLPGEADLTAYRQQMAAEYELPAHVISMIQAMPKDQHPMEVLQTVLPVLGGTSPADLTTHKEPTADGGTRSEVDNLAGQRREVMSVIAKIPTIVATFERHRCGLSRVAPDVSLDLMTNFLTMFHGEKPAKRDAEIFAICEALQMEHGFNASTFTARVVASTLSPVHNSISAAIGALYGKLHGGADEAAFRMAGEIGSPANAKDFIHDHLKNGGKVMGMGHRVYRTIDPRATILVELAHELTRDKDENKGRVLATLVEVARVMADIMKAKGKDIYPNVEFYKGPVFNALDIPADSFTAMFVMGRAFGWGAHILELWADHRLYRPRAQYIGERF